MDDLIRRQDAIKVCFDIRVANNYDIADLIEMLPSAQKKGEWIKTGQSFVFSEKFRNYSCSECGYDVDKTKFNFCPNCGADMRGNAK